MYYVEEDCRKRFSILLNKMRKAKAKSNAKENKYVFKMLVVVRLFELMSIDF